MGRAKRCIVALVAVIGCGTLARGDTLRGSALAENGSPARGAHVWALALKNQVLDRVYATTDDQGKFAVDLGSGWWRINANLGDQSVANPESIEVAEGRELKPVTLKLTPQSWLRARLIEAETGKPIVGGRLVLDNGLDPVTDNEGRFEVGGVNRASYHESFVVAPGRERLRVLFEMSEKPVTDLDIRVPRGGKVFGRVLDSDGKPVSGALVGRWESGSAIAISSLWVRADGQGRFEYDGLKLNVATSLGVIAEGFENALRDVFCSDPGGESLAIEFRLARNPLDKPGRREASGVASKNTASLKVAVGRNVTGVVLDPDQEPVVGATVRWGADRSDRTIETKTDAEGKFRLTLVPDDPEFVCVLPVKSDFAPDGMKVRMGGDQEVHITLAKARSAKGVVRDDRGTPFTGVTVVPILDRIGRYGFPLWERSTKTDAEGRFNLSGLPASGATFTFLRQGVSDLRDFALNLDEDNIVTMSAAGAIQGKVFAHDGKPVRNFRVLLNNPRERKPNDKSGNLFDGFRGTGLSYTSDDGSFLVRKLNVGSVHRVTVLAPGYGEDSIDRVIVEPIDRLDLGRPIEFLLPEAYHLKVRAVEAGSIKPVVDAWVALIYTDPSIDTNFLWANPQQVGWFDSLRARTNGEGLASFSPLSFSGATVVVQAVGYAREQTGWRDFSDELNVILTREAVVSGEILDAATGKPLDGLTVRLSSRTNGGRKAVLQPSDMGRFRLDSLQGEDSILSIVTNADLVLYQEQIKLEPGQTVTRTLRLTPGKDAAGNLLKRD